MSTINQSFAGDPGDDEDTEEEFENSGEAFEADVDAMFAPDDDE